MRVPLIEQKALDEWGTVSIQSQVSFAAVNETWGTDIELRVGEID